MLLLIASQVDDEAFELAQNLGPRARVLTPRDLSRRGWRMTLDHDSDRFVASGFPVSSSELAGVISFMPCVLPQELTHIQLEDRAYVASEMSSALYYWLSSLRCPLVNPPSLGCLCGPLWKVERWLALARSVGIPLRTGRRSTRSGERRPPSEMRVVTVLGDAFLPSDEGELALAARALADAAGVPYLRTWFTDEEDAPALVGARAIPDAADEATRHLLTDHFESAA